MNQIVEFNRNKEARKETSIERALKMMEALNPLLAEWRDRPPIGKAEIVECPICQGRLYLSQASSNGHVHGKCETRGCVHFME